MDYWEAKRILRQQAALVAIYPADELAEAREIVEEIDSAQK